MIIRYRNGYPVEALLLARRDNMMRVDIPGIDETVEFRQITGRRVSEGCDPFDVEFGSAHNGEESPVGLEDCVCSSEVAARLLDLLFFGEEADADRGAQNSSPQSRLPVSQRVD